MSAAHATQQLLLRQSCKNSQLLAFNHPRNVHCVETSKMENKMGIGDMMGKAAGALGGGGFDFGSKMEELGVDPSMLEGLDIESAKSLIADKGFDLSMLDGLGLNVEDLIGKFTGQG